MELKCASVVRTAASILRAQQAIATSVRGSVNPLRSSCQRVSDTSSHSCTSVGTQIMASQKAWKLRRTRRSLSPRPTSQRTTPHTAKSRVAAVKANGKAEAWDRYLVEVRAAHARKPHLLQVLDSFPGKAIIDSCCALLERFTAPASRDYSRMGERETFLDAEKHWLSSCRTEGASAARWSFLSQTGCERHLDVRTGRLCEIYGAFRACL